MGKNGAMETEGKKKIRKRIILILLLWLSAGALYGCNDKGSKTSDESKQGEKISEENEPLIGVYLNETGELVYTEEERQRALLRIQGSAESKETQGHSIQPENSYQVAYTPVEAVPSYSAEFSDDYATPSTVAVSNMYNPDSVVPEAAVEPIYPNQYPLGLSSEIPWDISESIVADTVIKQQPADTLSSTAVSQRSSSVIDSKVDTQSNHINPDAVYNFDIYNNPENHVTEDTYVLNTKSKKIHHPDCGDVAKIKRGEEGNYTTSSLPLEVLLAQGYTPCGHCFK